MVALLEKTNDVVIDFLKSRHANGYRLVAFFPLYDALGHKNGNFLTKRVPWSSYISSQTQCSFA